MLSKFWLFRIHRYFLFLPEVGIVKPVKFTRDSSCLARDDPLVISKGDYKLIYIFLFFCIFFEHCTVLHCTSWCCKLIRINFGITFWHHIVEYRLESGKSQKIRVTYVLGNHFSCEFKCVKPVKFTPDMPI